MGYQALLFCPDEKLARVISQVFNELDFAVDPVHEPFAAVKQLMAQRYDAVVVDCENEQNASLLFRSARNSSFNQSSLALALVEGQTGVAKAYRIGANLVLTKPINVEQAKGTLRIARGLLRKGADAATASASTTASAMAARAGAGSAGSSGTVVSANAGLASAPPRHAGESDFAPVSSAADAAPTPTATATPSSSASAQASVAAGVDANLDHRSIDRKSANQSFLDQSTNNDAAHTPSIAAQKQRQSGTAIDSARAPEVTQTTSTTATAGNHGSIQNAPKTEPPSSATTSASAKSSAVTVTSGTGSAAATAPAKELTTTAAKGTKVAETKSTSSSRASSTQAAASAVPTSTANASNLNVPSFGGLSQEGAGGSGRNKKILIAAVVIIALAALSYFSGGKPKFGTNRTEPANTQQDSSQPAPALKPMSSPSPSPSPSPASEPTPGATDVASSANHASPYPTATADKPAAGQGNPQEIRIGGNSESNTIATHASANLSNINSNLDSTTATKTTAPLQVKARAAKASSQTQGDESAPPAATLALASANDSNISNLMSPASFNLSKPALAMVKVSQGVSQGLLIKRVQPHYPQSALALHAQGAVQIEATINKEGSVVNPKVLKGDPLLARAALEAVRQWRYKPYYLDGGPVEIQTEITINFKAN